MSEKNEIWVCGHTRKCGWKGPQSEIEYRRDEKSCAKLGIESAKGHCPKCDNTEFYIRPASLTPPQENKA